MKVYAFKIPKKPKENLVVQRDKGTAFFDQLHQHEEIQTSLIVSGKGRLIVGDSIHSFNRGDFFVIGNGIPHLFKTVKSNEDSHMISLFFTKDSFGDSFFENEELLELNSFFNYVETGFTLETENNFIQDKMVALPSLAPLSRFVAFLTILQETSKVSKKRLSNFIHSKEISNSQGERLRTVFDFVMENFAQKIELHTVADLVHMTPNAFCRFFKHRTNKTFFKFLIEVRIEHACQLLIQNKDLSILEAANVSGFNSISNFNQRFKEIKGSSPTKYLQQLS